MATPRKASSNSDECIECAYLTDNECIYCGEAVCEDCEEMHYDYAHPDEEI